MFFFEWYVKITVILGGCNCRKGDVDDKLANLTFYYFKLKSKLCPHESCKLGRKISNTKLLSHFSKLTRFFFPSLLFFHSFFTYFDRRRWVGYCHGCAKVSRWHSCQTVTWGRDLMSQVTWLVILKDLFIFYVVIHFILYKDESNI